MNKGSDIKAVELFAGIGGFRLAAERHGIKTIWANDFDPEASKVYRDNFDPNTYVEGDIWKLIDEVPAHDLLTGGFPCQPFSSAGKKRGIEDPRGTLFEAIIKVLKKNQPTYFILENVKRLISMDSGKHFATILASLSELDYRIEWRLLNAMDFGLPQNRQRVVITGIRKDKFAADGIDIYSTDAIRLAHEEELNALAEETLNTLSDADSWDVIEDHSSAFPNWGIAIDGKFFATDIEHFFDHGRRVFLHNVLENDVDPVFDLTESTKARLGKNKEVNKYVGGVQILSNQEGGARMGYTIFGTQGVAPTLTSSTSRHYERYKVGEGYRRLTPVEYARIQGFPDDHCDASVLRNRYVLYGNAVPPPLVEWVMSKLLNPSRINVSVNTRLPLSYV